MIKCSYCGTYVKYGESKCGHCGGSVEYNIRDYKLRDYLPLSVIKGDMKGEVDWSAPGGVINIPPDKPWSWCSGLLYWGRGSDEEIAEDDSII